MDFARYDPPASSDYANVRTLNAAWLAATTDLQASRRQQLAETPFLLFSLREHDSEWWVQALQRQHDLLDAAVTAAAPIRRIQTAAIGFLWQLADRNAYAARLISGASVAWCDTLVAQPLVTVIERVGERADLLQKRMEIDALREPAAQLAALQGLLSQPQRQIVAELPAAACHAPKPALRRSDPNH